VQDDLQDMLLRTAGRVLQDHCGTALQQRCDAGEFASGLWVLLEEMGLTRAMAPESAGGAGLAFADVMPLIGLAAQHGLPLPLAETVLAHWLAGCAGLELADGPVALALSGSEGPWQLTQSAGGCSVTGTAQRLPWGCHARHALMVVPQDGGAQLVIVNAQAARIEHGANLAGEPRDTLHFNAAPARLAASPVTAYELLHLGAAMRAVQMAGASAQALSLACDYANIRVQFGKPISKQQVIQQYLAVMVGQSAAAAGAAALGVAGIQLGASGAAHHIEEFSVACAKARAGEAAGQVAALAHQVFGAIGFAREHSLHLLTRRLWSWREECGGESFWCERLGRSACAGGGQALWPLLAD
jgi:acyl-CoA dehydrogenase